MDTSLVITFVIVFQAIIWFVYLSRRRSAKRQEAYKAWVQDYEAWRDPLVGEASSPGTSPKRLRQLAAAAMPSDPIYHLAYLDILRLVATNPSTPDGIQSALISRIGSEESAIRTAFHLEQVQQQIRQSEKRRGGGGIISGGGVSFPLD